MKRSDFISSVAGTVLGRAVNAEALATTNPDHVVVIEEADVEVAAGRSIRTTTYNGQLPGPLLRMRVGKPTIIEIVNRTGTPEQLHFHGQTIPSNVDGASEEQTPYVPAHGQRRVAFTPKPAGLRFYHTHLRAGGDLTRGQYNGEVGPVLIEAANDPGAYDREIFLTLKEFEPSLTHGGDMAQTFLLPQGYMPGLQRAGEAAMHKSLKAGNPKGYEVGYNVFTINGRMLGHGEPIRVRRGERVLFRILNGSATEIRSLAMPGHSFRVVALDGNPVPVPRNVDVLWIGTAERIDAIVEMNEPGVWILGDTDDDDRGHGMGIVVEYSGSNGSAQWRTPKNSSWSYAWFGKVAAGKPPPPDEIINYRIEKRNADASGFNIWTLNGEPYVNGSVSDLSMTRTMTPSTHLRYGRRYRIRLENVTDDIHPVHLHRHSFELTSIGGRPTAGVIKDVAMLAGYQTMELDFIADNPGLTLFHCHQQLHMDFGFMTLFDYVSSTTN